MTKQSSAPAPVQHLVLMYLLSLKLATLWHLLQKWGPVIHVVFSYFFFLLRMTKQGASLSGADHTENIGRTAGRGGEERHRESESKRESFMSWAMEDGEETSGRPAGLSGNCVQWWRGRWWESARSRTTRDAAGNSNVCHKTAVKHKFSQMRFLRENNNRTIW